MKVFCYFNLHEKVWSLKAMEGKYKGKVVAHAENVTLAEVLPKVSEAGRQRVIKEQKKNVHAGLVGTVLALGGKYSLKYPVEANIVEPLNSKLQNLTLVDPNIHPERILYYNPYKTETFTYQDSGEPYTGSRMAFLVNTGRKVYAIG